jgi:hypothetical protein
MSWSELATVKRGTVFLIRILSLGVSFGVVNVTPAVESGASGKTGLKRGLRDVGLFIRSPGRQWRAIRPHLHGRDERWVVEGDGPKG